MAPLVIAFITLTCCCCLYSWCSKKEREGFPVWVEGARGRELTSKCRLNCVGMETIAVLIIPHSDALKLACHPVTQLDAMIQEMW